MHSGHLGRRAAGNLDHAAPRVVAEQVHQPFDEPGHLAGDLSLHHEFVTVADLDRVGHDLDPREARLREVPPGKIGALEHQRELPGRPGREPPPRRRHPRRGEQGGRQPRIDGPGARAGGTRLLRGRRHQFGDEFVTHGIRRGGIMRLGCECLGGHDRLGEVETGAPLVAVRQLPSVGASGSEPSYARSENCDRNAEHRDREPASHGVVQKQKPIEVGRHEHQQPVHRCGDQQPAEQSLREQPPAESGERGVDRCGELRHTRPSHFRHTHSRISRPASRATVQPLFHGRHPRS